MTEFLLQPAVYGTGQRESLFEVVEDLWAERAEPHAVGDTFSVVSGFATHNGGLPFFERFRDHIADGGVVRAVFGGSANTRLTSRQLVDALIDAGVEVSIVNRKHILHAKLYGRSLVSGEQHLVVTSGNFTGPGMARNIEATLALDAPDVAAMNFSWDDLFAGLLEDAGFEVFHATQASEDDPRWALLYDENARTRVTTTSVDEADGATLESMILTLSRSDTARIQADKGTSAYEGSQYFWLSKKSYDFFPPLTIRNRRGRKATYQTLVNAYFEDIDVSKEVRVTFEQENNVDFRLGTGPLRGTKLADQGDMAVITRRDFTEYDIRIVKKGTPEFYELGTYALEFIGNKGKRIGFAPNDEVDRILKRGE